MSGGDDERRLFTPFSLRRMASSSLQRAGLPGTSISETLSRKEYANIGYVFDPWAKQETFHQPYVRFLLLPSAFRPSASVPVPPARISFSTILATAL